MNVLKADTGNFNKLLASVGLILIALAFVAPWLFMRETGVLLIRETDMAAYTKEARDVLGERQDRIAAIQSLMPEASLMLFVAGAVMVFFGAKGMKEFQPWEAMEARARARQAEASIQPQTEQDRDESAERDVEVEVLAESQELQPVSDAESSSVHQTAPTPNLLSSRALADRRRRTREAEGSILDRLTRRTWEGFDFAAEVKVTSPNGQALLLIDALLRAHNPTHADVLIEIRTITSARAYLTRPTSDQVIAAVHKYEWATGRQVVPWLVVAVDEFDPPAVERFKERMSAEILVGKVSIGPLDALDWLDEVEPSTRAVRRWIMK